MRNSALVQRTNYLQTKYRFGAKISTREEWVANSGFRDHVQTHMVAAANKIYDWALRWPTIYTPKKLSL